MLEYIGLGVIIMLVYVIYRTRKDEVLEFKTKCECGFKKGILKCPRCKK